MKKRLLSAALALAMVLTMLPLTAFAADPPETKSVTWYAKDAKFPGTLASGQDEKASADGWYYYETTDGKRTYTVANSGVLNSSSKTGSATWVSSVSDAIALKWTTIRPLADISETISVDYASLTIDVMDGAVSGAVSMTKGGTLNIKNTNYKSTDQTLKTGAGAITMGEGNQNYSATVNLTNVSATSITMEKVGSHTVKLDNAELSGAVKMTGIGKYTNTSSKEVDVNARQQFSALNGSSVGSTLDVTGNSSTITVTNSTITGKTSLTGTSTSITVNGSESELTGGVDLLASTVELKSGTAPKITVNGGKVEDINDGTDEKLENAKYTVEVNSGSNAETGAIDLPNADIRVKGGTAGAITLNTGSLSVTENGTVGNVTWGGANSGTVNLTVSGENSTVGTLKPGSGNKAALGTVSITGGNFGTGFDLGSYANNGVSGGVFASSLLGKTGWLSKSVAYEATNNSSYYYLGSDFQTVVNTWKTLGNNAAVKRINAASSGTSTITFVMEPAENAKDDVVLATITGNPGEAILAPGSVNNVAVSQWYVSGGSDTYTAGTAIPFPKASTELKVYATLPGSDNSDILKVIAEDGISAVLDGSVIRLSGYAPADSAASFAIPLTIVTANNQYDEAATVTWWSELKTFGLTVKADMPFAAVSNSLAYNGRIYTIDISGLKLLASSNISINGDAKDASVGTDIKGIKVAFNAGESASRPAFAEAVVGAGALVDFSNSPAVLEALNREAGKITNLKTYLDAAKRAKAKEAGYPNPTQTQLEQHGGAYNKVVLQPYLNVTVRAYTPGGSGSVGSMTADITPYYYIVVIGGSGDDPYVYNPNGTSLGTLSGDYGAVEVTLGLPTNFTPASKDIWVHHGDYAYKATLTNTTSIEFNTLHGFSSFMINGVPSAVSVDHIQGDSTPTERYYDSLQAAVNDVADTGKIILMNNYKGSTSVNVSGLARVFTVDCGTNGNLALTFTGADVSTTRPTNNEYKVTLSANSASAATAKITVGSAGNGSATVNVSSAKPGSSVSGTYKANSGYKAGSFTATAQPGNKSVSVSVSANGTFSFTVPSDATSVTVTPSFVLDNGLPFTDVANNAWYFTAVKYCYDTTNNGYRLMEGDSATTFAPNGSFTRAHMVQILWNMKGRPTPRTTANPFRDMSSSNWYYSAVLWAYENGYAKGYPDGTFKPGQAVTRQEMVQFLYQASGSPSGSGNLSYYSDGYTANNWAQPALRWATGLGILSGQNSASLGNTLAPRAVAKRCEVAVTVMNFDKLNLF